MTDISAQDLMQADLFSSGSSDLKEVLEFFKNNGVSLSREQVKALTFLSHLGGYENIIENIMSYRTAVVPVSYYIESLAQVTLADRIKGTAKLSALLRANGDA